VTFTPEELQHNHLEEPWTPTLAMPGVSEWYDEEVLVHARRYYVSRDGLVSFRRPFNVRIACAMNFKYLPYDKHTCSVDFIAAHLEDYEAKLHASDVLIPLPQMVSSAAWVVSPQEKWRLRSQEVLQAGITTSVNKTAARFIFEVERRSESLSTIVTAPTALYWLISYTGFYVAPKATPAKAAMHTLPVLMMVNQLVYVSSILPAIGYPYWLKTYVLNMLVLVVVQLCSFGLVDFGRSYDPSLAKPTIRDLQKVQVVQVGSAQGSLDFGETSGGPMHPHSARAREAASTAHATMQRLLIFWGQHGDMFNRCFFLLVMAAIMLDMFLVERYG